MEAGTTENMACRPQDGVPGGVSLRAFSPAALLQLSCPGLQLKDDRKVPSLSLPHHGYRNSHLHLLRGLHLCILQNKLLKTQDTLLVVQEGGAWLRTSALAPFHKLGRRPPWWDTRALFHFRLPRLRRNCKSISGTGACTQAPQLHACMGDRTRHTPPGIALCPCVTREQEGSFYYLGIAFPALR